MRDLDLDEEVQLDQTTCHRHDGVVPLERVKVSQVLLRRLHESEAESARAEWLAWPLAASSTPGIRSISHGALLSVGQGPFGQQDPATSVTCGPAQPIYSC